jgi:anti-sigma28 factor (negative regulator of flagellin synthesis)
MRIQGSGPHAVESKKDGPRTEKRERAGSEGSAVVVKADASGVAGAVAREASAHDARVAEIALQLDKGTYQVDKDKLAARIFEDEVSRVGAAK